MEFKKKNHTFILSKTAKTNKKCPFFTIIALIQHRSPSYPIAHQLGIGSLVLPSK